MTGILYDFCWARININGRVSQYGQLDMPATDVLPKVDVFEDSITYIVPRMNGRNENTPHLTRIDTKTGKTVTMNLGETAPELSKMDNRIKEVLQVSGGRIAVHGESTLYILGSTGQILESLPIPTISKVIRADADTLLLQSNGELNLERIDL